MERKSRERGPGSAPTAGAGSAEAGTSVYLRRRDAHIEVRFARGFTQEDVESVKSIRGRRWNPERRIWTVPDTPEALEALVRKFGERLVRPGESSGGSPSEGPEARGRGEVPSPVGGGGSPVARDDDSAHPIQGTRAAHTHVESLLRRLQSIMRTREYSPKTERAYIGWVRRFYRFHGRELTGTEEVAASHATAFLEHLANRERLAPKSRNQAASALGFLYREIFGRDDMARVPRANGPRRVPTVLSHREAMRVISMLRGKYALIASLLYSAGLRIEECLRIRVKDIDFELRQILVRDGKGRKDRFVPLADRVCDLLRAQIRSVKELHERDRAGGGGWAPLPGALHRKDPTAGYELAWQFVFPASAVSKDPATDRTGRAPLHATAVQRAVKDALRRSGIQKRASCHTFRHSFATELLRGGCDIRTLQQVMGHKDIRTTMIYLHAVEQTGLGIRSPLDRPDEDPSTEAW